MDSAIRAGRVIGVLLIIHMIGSGMVNFVMERPLAEGEFLAKAASNSQQIGLAVILGLITEALWIGVAISAFPIFFPRSQRMALWIVALAAVAFAVAVVENIGVLSMVSLSEAYTKASAVEREQIQAASVVVTAVRDWPHFLSRIFVAAMTFVFYFVLYRFAMVPRVLGAFGLIAALMVVTSLALPLFGYKVIFPMLAPMAVCHLLLAVWLIAKGFRLQLSNAFEPGLPKEE